MSVREKPSIYNAPSVYNQGGGGDGSFTVDLGGGVSQELKFPPYLIPIEYIDTENYSENKLLVSGCFQYSLTQTLIAKFVFTPAMSKMSNNSETIPFICNKFSSLDNTKRMSVLINRGNGPGHDTAMFAFGNINPTLVDLDLDAKKTTFLFDAAQRKLTLNVDGSTHTANHYAAYPNSDIGQFSFGGLYSGIAYTYFGKFHFGYITDNGLIIALFMPARSKDTSNKQPYIVECVRGAVAVNGSDSLNTNGIEFGPDIDLSDIGNYFQ